MDWFSRRLAMEAHKQQPGMTREINEPLVPRQSSPDTLDLIN